MEEILEKGEYNFDTADSLDNYWSMDRFIKDFNLQNLITLHEGTYIELTLEDGSIYGCHSGGRGDFYSHQIKFDKL